MSIIKEQIKKKGSILSAQIKKELDLLPKIFREKKIEYDTMARENILLKEKSSFFQKELEKISFNIMSLEKDYSLIIIKNDKIKSQQKVLLNSINNEIPLDLNDFLKNDKIRELMMLILNFENNFSEQLVLVFENRNELTSLFIGSYIYFKMLKNDFPNKYQKLKKKINNLLIEIKELDNNNIFLSLIINYIENIFKLLDNKEKTLSFEKKIESFNKKKVEIFIKLKVLEEKIKEKENILNTTNNYMKDLISLLEKYKLFMKYSKTKKIKNNNENKTENNSGNNLNISCPNNHHSKRDNKNSINYEFRNTNNKISYINIDLTNFPIEKDLINNKKTIDSIDDINDKINNSSSLIKLMNISNYNNINDLEKDIYINYSNLKCHPLYSLKINNRINLINNNPTNTISINLMSKKNNKTNIISNNKVIKNKINIAKNSQYIQKKDSLHKSNNKDKKTVKKNMHSENKTIINQSNTTMTYDNILANNSKEVNNVNTSNDSNINKNPKINHYTSSNYIKKNSPQPLQEKIHKPGGKNKQIPYLTQNYQNTKGTQRKTNEMNIRKKNNNNSKETKNIFNSKSPINSPHKTKILMNINNINNTSNKINTPFPNLESINYNTEQIKEKVNQSSYSKKSQKNIYINIKHNKTNLCKEGVIGKNLNEKRNKKSINKIKVDLGKSDIKNSNNSEIKEEKKISPNKQSSSNLLNIINSEENNNKANEKPKLKEINKINIDLDKCKNKSPTFKKRQFYDKFNKEIKNEIKEIENNDIINKNMNNSLNNINKNCQIIPFKKNKINRKNINYVLEKKNLNKNIKNNKSPKTSTNYNSEKNEKIKEKEDNIEVNFNNNSHIVENKVKREINNYYFNKKDYKNCKKSYKI